MTRRILLIDFEKRSLESTRSLLEGAGYDVAAARTGAEAMTSIEEVRPAVVVLEPMIPGQDGFKLCQSLKRGDHGPPPHVVVASRIYRGPKYRNMAREAGADAYLERPQQDAQLVETIARALPPAERPDDAPERADLVPAPLALADLLEATFAAAPAPAAAPPPAAAARPAAPSGPRTSAAPAAAFRPTIVTGTLAASAPAARSASAEPCSAVAVLPAPALGDAVALEDAPDLLGDPALDLLPDGPHEQADYRLNFRPSDDEIESALLNVLGPDPVAPAAPAAAADAAGDRARSLAEAVEAQAMAVLDLTFAAEDAATGPAAWSPGIAADVPMDTGYVVVDPSVAGVDRPESLDFDFPLAAPRLPGGLDAALDRVELPSQAPRTLEDAAGYDLSAIADAPVPAAPATGFEFDLLPEPGGARPAARTAAPRPPTPAFALAEDPEVADAAPSDSSLPSLPSSLLDGFDPTSPGENAPSDPFGGAAEPNWDRLFPPTTGASAPDAATLAPAVPGPPPSPAAPRGTTGPPTGGTDAPPTAPEDLDADLERAFAGLSLAGLAPDPAPVLPAAADGSAAAAPVVEAGIEVPTGLRGMDAGTAELLSSLEELENSMPEDAPSYLESGWAGTTGTGAALEIQPSTPHAPPPPHADDQGLEDAIFSAQAAPDPLPPPPDWSPSRPELEIEPLAGSPGDQPDTTRGELAAVRRPRPTRPDPPKAGGGLLTGWLFGALALVIVLSGAAAMWRHLAGSPRPASTVAAASDPAARPAPDAAPASKPAPGRRAPAAARAAATAVPQRPLPESVRQVAGPPGPRVERPRPQAASTTDSPAARPAPLPAAAPPPPDVPATDAAPAADAPPAPAAPPEQARPEPARPESAPESASGSGSTAAAPAVEPSRAAPPAPAPAPGGVAPLVRSSDLDEPLRPVDAPAPAAPPEASRDGALGKVYLNVLVGPDGSVREAKVMIEPGHGLGEAARDAVLRWVYTRPTRGGVPVRVWKAEVVDFSR